MIILVFAIELLKYTLTVLKSFELKLFIMKAEILIWLFPSVFIIHEFEEIILMRSGKVN